MNTFLEKLNNSLIRIKLTDKLFFTQNLNLMIRSGITLDKSLESLTLQTENVKFKKILEDIRGHVQKGGLFSDALKLHNNVFSDIFINMIAAGEESGKLEDVLKTLTIQMHKEHDLRSKVKGAVAYPVVVLTAMLSITTGLIVFVIPNLTRMFTEGGLELPLPTKILIAVSTVMARYFYILVVVVIGALIGFLKFRKTITGKRILHKIVLRSPILGKLAVKVNLARIARALSSLLKTDIPVVKSFTIASHVISNIYYQEALRHIAKTLKTGTSIRKGLEQYIDLFTPTIIQMVSVGEETGTTDEILQEIALFYEEDLDNTLKNLPSLLEPVLILLLGVTVGGIAIAIMLPIFNFTQSAGG